MTALGAVAAAPAGANTLSYSGSLASGDPRLPFIRVDQNGATGCATTLLPTVGSSGNPSRAFAFRNAAGAADCITVTVSNPNCPVAGTFEFSAVFPDSQLLGSDGLGGCDATRAYSFNAPSGQTFSTFLLGAASTPFGVSVQGTQHQLDTTYASCPDPSTPLGGSFTNTGVGQQMMVVANGPQT